jgi:general secretion pathway protein L
VTQQVFARALHDGLWQWRQTDAEGRWQGASFHTGDSEALKSALPSSTTPVNIVVRGQQVVATQIRLDAKQSKHAAKLIPFELEDELSGSVDELHFAFKAAEDDHFSVCCG